jgi:hypothetical protein
LGYRRIAEDEFSSELEKLRMPLYTEVLLVQRHGVRDLLLCLANDIEHERPRPRSVL